MKHHALLRLTDKIYNTPHLLTASALSTVLDYLELRNSNGIVKLDILEDEVEDTIEDDSKEEDYPGGIGLLRVDGALTYKPVMTLCGVAGTSYQQLVSSAYDMAEAGVKTIVMEVNSPGGEASHVFEYAQNIRDTCDKYGITLIGYADTMAASAGYALLCVCDYVVANPSAEVGSIGAVVALKDTSKAMASAGVKVIFITSGKNKVPFEDDGSFKQGFLDKLQTRVDELNEEFSAHVSVNTGLSVKAIQDMEAQIFSAKEALEKGLVNAVMTTKDFAIFVEEAHKGRFNEE